MLIGWCAARVYCPGRSSLFTQPACRCGQEGESGRTEEEARAAEFVRNQWREGHHPSAIVFFSGSQVIFFPSSSSKRPDALLRGL